MLINPLTCMKPLADKGGVKGMPHLRIDLSSVFATPEQVREPRTLCQLTRGRQDIEIHGGRRAVAAVSL